MNESCTYAQGFFFHRRPCLDRMPCVTRRLQQTKRWTEIENNPQWMCLHSFASSFSDFSTLSSGGQDNDWEETGAEDDDLSASARWSTFLCHSLLHCFLPKLSIFCIFPLRMKNNNHDLKETTTRTRDKSIPVPRSISISPRESSGFVSRSHSISRV